MTTRGVSGTSGTPTTSSGPGRVLVAVYGVLAIAATFRSGVQIVRDLDQAPVAYLLSGFAAIVYVLATIGLARGTGAWRRVAWMAVLVELVGVIVVGTLSLVATELFPDATVWSAFGQGYGYVPAVLPVLGILWLRRTGRVETDGVPGTGDRPGTGSRAEASGQ